MCRKIKELDTKVFKGSRASDVYRKGSGGKIKALSARVVTIPCICDWLQKEDFFFNSKINIERNF